MTVQDPAVGKEVRAIGLGLYQSRANHVSSFTIHTAGYPHHDFDVVVTGPEGNAVPVRCYQQKDGNLLAEFNATNTGTSITCRSRVSQSQFNFNRFEIWYAHVHILVPMCSWSRPCHKIIPILVLFRNSIKICWRRKPKEAIIYLSLLSSFLFLFSSILF